MKARTAFIIFAYAVLALVVEIILIWVVVFGSWHPNIGGILTSFFLLVFLVTLSVIVASAVSGIAGIILRRKSVPIWLFWGLTVAILLFIAYFLLFIFHP